MIVLNLLTKNIDFKRSLRQHPIPLSPLVAALCSAAILSGCSLSPKEESPSSSATVVKPEENLSLSGSPLANRDKALDKQLVQTDHNLTIKPNATPEHYDNVWDEIASNMSMGNRHQEAFEGYLNFYLKNHKHLTRVSERAQPYLHYIFSEVKKRGMPYEIALLPIIESAFRPEARSHQSAVGLWQFIPQTGHLYGLERNWWYDGRQDVIQSTQAALDYLQKLYELNDDDWLLALASYNGGIGNVWKAAKKYRRKHGQKEPATFWQIRNYLPKETQHYVPQLLAVAHAVKHRDLFGLKLEPVANQPFFEVFELEKQVALDKVASLSDTPSTLLAQLNPGYLRPATPPNGPHHIILPIDRRDRFSEHLDKDDTLFDIQWTRHRIQRGDTLSEIAQAYNTSSNAIKKLNGLKNNRIRIGKTLMIPLPQQYAKKFNQDTQTRNRYSGPKFIHTVKSGESLWKIARYYNTDTKTLCRWNNIGVRTPLRKGQELEIRSGQYGKQIEYTLQKGDSLWIVARRFNVTTTELSRWNGLKRSQTVHPGMKLAVWLPGSAPDGVAKTKGYKQYVVKTGDNLWLIAKANNLSTRAIARYNKITENAYLKPGQVLKIPYDQET